MEKRMARAALYIRVSTQDQNLELQRSELIEYAERRGWKVVEIFEDKATGTNDNRPQLKAMMKAARARQFDILAVWKLDRAFRSLKDCMNGLHELADLGVEFVSLRDSGIDMTTPSGRLLLSLLAAFAEFEASIIRERVRAGVRAKIAKTGRWGRTKTRNDDSIVALRSKGLSIRQIARKLGIAPTTVRRGLAGPITPKKVGA